MILPGLPAGLVPARHWKEVFATAEEIAEAAVWLLRRRRLNRWKDMPLLFEDQLPTEVHPLRLSVD